MDKDNNKAVYLDHAASAPLEANVLKVMKKFLTVSGANPSALHKEGIEAKMAVEKARGSIARILGAQKEEIIFTSGGTESNNLAILGTVSEYVSHIVTTNIEHPSVLEVCRHLENTKQREVTYVSVEENGIVDRKKIKEAIKKNTILFSVMYANNEIGTIQPIMEIAKEIRHYRKINNSKYPYFHTDATQAMNYLPVKVDKLGIDLLSFNGSKIYGPKGIGVLYKKRNCKLEPIMWGGDQEFGLKPGTENVAGIGGISRALEITEEIKEKESKRLTKLRDYFIKQLSRRSLDSKIKINGDLEKRLPNNVNISVKGIESDLLVIELDARGIAVSSKSACQSDGPDESYVIAALRSQTSGAAPRPAKPWRSGGSLTSPSEEGSVCFSLGRNTNKADIDYTLKALSSILAKLKKWS